MLIENIQIIKNSLLQYIGNGTYYILFIIALLYIFVKEKDKNRRVFFIGFSVIILIIILNPLFFKCVNKLITKYIYWRTFWLVPLGLTLAYTGTMIIKSVTEKSKKIAVSISLILIIIFSGKFIYTKENYAKYNNWYKIPDEYLSIINIIGDIQIDDKKSMVSIELMPYIRQINANIKLPYDRKPAGDYEMYPIVTYYNSGDVENLVKLCKEQNVNIIVYDKSIPLTISPEFYGYKLYKQVENYDIYVLNE